MKIVVAGAGETGVHLVKLLSNEFQSVTLIDNNEEHLGYASSHLDIKVIKGDATSISTLEDAEVRTSDMTIAVTSSETANITCCFLAKQLGCKRTVARVSNPEYIDKTHQIDFAHFGVDEMISPEELASKEIQKLLGRSALSDIFEFEGGALIMMGTALQDNSPFIDNTIKDVISSYSTPPFTCIAIQRKETQYTIIPRGNTVFRKGDQVYLIVPKSKANKIHKLMQEKQKNIKKVMIVGGSKIGQKAAKNLCSKKFNVKLIEQDYSKAEKLSEKLSGVLVINGNGSNMELLKEQNISETDAFVAVTQNSETNIMSCLMAKHKGVKRTIALVENIDYFRISNSIGIDTLINKKLLTANNIFRYIRRGNVLALAKLSNTNAEILEFEVKEHSKINRKRIKDLVLPRSAVIGGVIRQELGMVTLGNFEIKEGDKIVVCCLLEAISKMEKLFD